jgi:hypothetical protein
MENLFTVGNVLLFIYVVGVLATYAYCQVNKEDLYKNSKEEDTRIVLLSILVYVVLWPITVTASTLLPNKKKEK